MVEVLTRQKKVAIIGLGAEGMALAAHLSQNPDVQVIGIDKNDPPHDKGGSGGDTRLTRCSFEDITDNVKGVPGLNETSAHTIRILRELEDNPYISDALHEKFGARQLYVPNDVLMMGGNVQGASHGYDKPLDMIFKAAVANDIEHEEIDAKEVMRRNPEIDIPDDIQNFRAFLQKKDSGTLMSRATIFAHKLQARAHGADLRMNTEVVDLMSKGPTTEVVLKAGKGEISKIQADEVVLCPGPWVGDFARGALKEIFNIRRQLMCNFDLADNSKFMLPHSDNFVIFGPDGKVIYGTPRYGPLKISIEKEKGWQKMLIPDRVRETFNASKVYFPNLVQPDFDALRPDQYTQCWYTMTNNGKFFIDQMLRDVWLVSACSGHGFKHAAALMTHLGDFISGKGKIDLRDKYGLACHSHPYVGQTLDPFERIVRNPWGKFPEDRLDLNL